MYSYSHIQSAKMERERLRAEIARDKEARRANAGVLPRYGRKEI